MHLILLVSDAESVKLEGCLHTQSMVNTKSCSSFLLKRESKQLRKLKTKPKTIFPVWKMIS